MASLQEPGIIKIFAREPNGNRHILHQGRVELLAPAGGAPEGAATSVQTPEKLLYIPRNDKVTLRNDWFLDVEFTADGADGIDVSDCIWNIPVWVQGAGMKHLTRADFANPTPTDYTTVAAIPVTVGGYKVVEGALRFGGGVIFLDFQDDTG